MIDLEIKGLKDLQDSFAKSPQIADAELQRATKEAGKQILRTEVKEAPHKTGHLQQSIRMNYTPIKAEIYPTMNYAYWVHEGTDSHTIRPSRSKVLRFKTKSGKVVYTKLVRHPGTKENKFVDRTVVKVQSTVDRLFDTALNNILNKLSQ